MSNGDDDDERSSILSWLFDAVFGRREASPAFGDRERQRCCRKSSARRGVGRAAKILLTVQRDLHLLAVAG
jgi:hypothetical protein